MSAGTADTATIKRDFPFLTRERLGKLPAAKEREFYCEDCVNRVTVSIDGDRVFGHARDCPHMVKTKNGISRRSA